MAEKTEPLAKRLGLLGVYAIATGATLSAGFFLLPGLAAVEAGPALVLAYVLAAVPLLPGILSKVELMTALPRAGGIYYFLDRSMGPLVGTIGGLGIWLVLMLKVSFALVGMGAYLAIFLPGLPVVPVAVALALTVGFLNLRGAKLTGGVQIALVVGILAILFVFVGFGLPAIETVHFQDFFGSGPRSLLATAGLVFVSYAGLTKPAAVAEEVEDPERNLRLGVFLAFGTALTVYVAGTAVIVGVVPMEELRGDLTSVATAGGRIFGPGGVVLLTAAAFLAFTAVTNAGTLSASRYPLAMSRDGILPPSLNRLNERGMPSVAIRLTVGIMILVIVFLDPMAIAKLASAFKLLVFSLLCLAVIVMRESRIEEYDPGYRTPLYPWTQVVGILAPWVLIVGMGWMSVLFSLGIVVAAGGWYWRYARDSVSREGAIYHIFERLGRKRYEGLEREFREILREKGLREEDPYLETVARARVIDVAADERIREIVERASEALAEQIPVSAERLTMTFVEEVELGITPVAHGAALFHARITEIDEPELLILRSVPGLSLGVGRDRSSAEEIEVGEGGDGRDRPPIDQRIHAIFFLVSPEDDPRQHLRMLAKLADHVSKDEFLERWIGVETRDGEDLKEILLREERALSFRIRDSGATAKFVGRTLGEAVPSDRALVALLRRGEEVMDARQDTELREGDRLTILGTPEVIDRLRRRFGEE